MTALQALSSALATRDDPPSPPSDEFQFESEYVKRLLSRRTPSPIVQKQAHMSNEIAGKENVDRWKTPVTIGATVGRTILGQRDVNSGLARSASVIAITHKTDTPDIKLSSSQPAPSTLSHSTSRYPRRGRLSKLGPPKRTTRLSSDSMDDPSEVDTPPEAPKSASLLSTIQSTGAEEVKVLRGLIQLEHHNAILNVNGQYTPPPSQYSPPINEKERISPEQQLREKTPAEREQTPPVHQDTSMKGTPHSSYDKTSRRVSSSTSSSESTRVSSASKSLGRSSLRNLIASTSPKPLDVALEGVQKGLEALTIRKTEEAQTKPYNPVILTAPKPLSPPRVQPPFVAEQRPLDRKVEVERDISLEFVPPRGVNVNILPTRKKSVSPPNNPPLRELAVPNPPLMTSLSQAPPNPINPPPKMRGLDPEPEAKSPSNKGKAVVLVNNRPYTRLSTIGRGGSSKVYKVISPQTNKIYALKKVPFDKADQTAIAGYKNEIRLLNRMAEREEASGVSHCIRLFDWETCDDKGYLLMLMECGEIDFAHILAKHQGVPLGLNFIRVYWEQMLRAVQAIHEEKIIHSDLKPANFLLVQGQLKLIDFGIAKRMSDDTTNIHRDQQIGTVNYMSPEAILDTNHNNPHLPPGSSRLMKLGKKSDVWSLGCILYQMIYGKTPFSDLTMYQKIQSIPDENHPIKFPATGTGGLRVDRGAERCVRMCLVRDQRKRWGIEELLKDRFLCGEGEDERLVGITAEEIGTLIEQTLGFGRMNGGKMLSRDTIETLAKDAFEKLRATRLRE